MDLDNSELTICAKIRKYFEDKEAVNTTDKPLNCSTSSDEEDNLSSSFKQLLNETKDKLAIKNKTMQLNESTNRKNKEFHSNKMDITEKTMIDDETMNFSDYDTPTDTMDLINLDETKIRKESKFTVNLETIDLTETLVSDDQQIDDERETIDLCSSKVDEAQNISNISEPLSPYFQKILDDTKSRILNKTNDHKIVQQFSAESADDSFLHHERMCKSNSNSPAQSPALTATSNDETQLFDVSAPSCLWDQTTNDISLKHIVASSPLKVFPNRPSTIIEETSGDLCQTGNSSQNRSSDPSNSDCSAKNKSDSTEISSDSIERTPPRSVKSKIDFSAFTTISTIKRRPFLCEPNSFRSDGAKSKCYGKGALSILKSKHQSSPLGSIENITYKSCLLNRYKSIESPKDFRLSPALPTSPIETSPSSSAASFSSNDQSRDFNDTIEAMEFYIERGKQINKKSGKSSRTKTLSSPQSPLSKSPAAFSPKKLNNNSLLKPSRSSPPTTSPLALSPLFTPKKHNNSLLKQAITQRQLMNNNSNCDNINKPFFNDEE